MEVLGNISLLERKKIGYFASGTIATLSVLPIIDWAAEIAKREDVAVVSGFHSKMEREVLDFLLNGKCGIICVLARSLYKNIPREYMEAYNQGRVLFLSEEKQPRPTKESAFRRNRLVVTLADELVIPIIPPESSLYNLVSSDKKTTIL